MAELQSIDVLCAYPVNDLYNFNHRVLFYVALASVVLLPVHRWLTPAALSLVVLYSFSSVFYVIALFLAPDRLGPTLDIFPLHSILIVDTYAMAFVVFLRSDVIRGKRRWALVTKLFMWLWGSFYLAGYVKSTFEKRLASSVTTVDCRNDSDSLPGKIFSASQGLACQNPCPSHHTPIIWGSLDMATKTFSAFPRPNASTGETLVAITFGIALSATLWLNFFTSPQTTRNTVFAIFTRSRRDSRGLRSALAKAIALFWFTWSYFCLLIVALAFPSVIWLHEEILKRYPVANTMCLIKQYLPWVIGMCIGLMKVTAIRRRRKEVAKVRSDRRTRLSNVLASLQSQIEQAGLVESHQSSATVSGDATITTSSEMLSPPAENPQAEKTYKINITEVRKIKGFFDHFYELKEWWVNPTGAETIGDDLPSADEEKALLREHFEQQE
jgi:hypothetical protein